MFAYLKHLAKHSLNYAFAEIITKALGFLLIPLYTRFLLPSDYGIVSTLAAITGILGVFYEMGQLGSWQRFYYDYQNNEKELKDYLGTIIIFIFVSVLTCTILLNLIGYNVFRLFVKDVPFKPYIQIALWSAFFSLFIGFWKRLFQVRQKSAFFGLLSIGQFLVSTMFMIYFVVYLRQGALGMVKAAFFASLLFFGVALFGFRKEIALKLNLKKLKESLAYGLPLLPHGLAGWISTLADRLIIGNYKNMESVGLYSIGYNFGSIMSMIVTAINFAYVPFFMSTAKAKDEEAKAIFARIATYYLAAILLIALIISIFAKEVIMIMTTPSFYAAYKVVPLIAFSFVLNGMYYFVVNPIFYVKSAIKYLPLATFTAAGVNLLMNFILIPRFGYMGAAYSSLLSFSVSLVLTWFISHRVYPIRFEYKKIILIWIAIAPALFLGLCLSNMNLLLWMSIILKILATASYPIILVVFGIIQWSQIKGVIGRVALKLS